jgi:hypothetical protein
VSGCVLQSGEMEGGGNFSWKIMFANGGTGVVLPVFLRLMEKRKKKGTNARLSGDAPCRD